MEFKFRATDKQPSSMHPPPSSTFNYFTDQATPAGNYKAMANYNPDLGRNREFFSNQFNVRETIRRELEKERIREEIIVSELARRRALVEEVRIEMMVEREMAMRRGELFSYPPETSRLNSRLSVVNQLQGVMLLEERIAFSLEDRFRGFASGRRIGGIELLPFGCNVEPTMAEVTRNTKLGKKRKSLTPLKGDPSGHQIGKAKKPKEEWSCAICQVSATSKRLLNEHLQGKRHKTKETAFGAEKEGKNFGIGLIPKERVPSSKPQERDPQSNQNLENTMPAKGKKENLEKDNVEMNGGDVSKKYTKPGRRCASEYKFWCVICEIGVDNEKVMEGHKMGKKHQYRLKNLDKKGEDGIGAQVLAAQSIEVDQKVNETAGKGDCPGKVERSVDGSKEKDKKKSEFVKFVLRGLAATSDWYFWCEMCEYGCATKELMQYHKMDKEHQARVQEVNKKDGNGAVLATHSVEVDEKLNESVAGEMDSEEKFDDESRGSGAVFASQSVDVDEKVKESFAEEMDSEGKFDCESTGSGSSF